MKRRSFLVALAALSIVVAVGGAGISLGAFKTVSAQGPSLASFMPSNGGGVYTSIDTSTPQYAINVVVYGPNLDQLGIPGMWPQGPVTNATANLSNSNSCQDVHYDSAVTLYPKQGYPLHEQVMFWTPAHATSTSTPPCQPTAGGGNVQVIYAAPSIMYADNGGIGPTAGDSGAYQCGGNSDCTFPNALSKSLGGPDESGFEFGRDGLPNFNKPLYQCQHNSVPTVQGEQASEQTECTMPVSVPAFGGLVRAIEQHINDYSKQHPNNLWTYNEVHYAQTENLPLKITNQNDGANSAATYNKQYIDVICAYPATLGFPCDTTGQGITLVTPTVSPYTMTSSKGTPTPPASNTSSNTSAGGPPVATGSNGIWVSDSYNGHPISNTYGVIQVAPGQQSQTIEVSFKNDGSASWNPPVGLVYAGDRFPAGGQAVKDTTLCTANWTDCNRGVAAKGTQTVGPGGMATFDFQVTASKNANSPDIVLYFRPALLNNDNSVKSWLEPSSADSLPFKNMTYEYFILDTTQNPIPA